MKRGQLLGMPLVLLFSLIVGALILAYGAKVAYDLVSQADYVDFLSSLDDIEANVETFSNYDAGSAKVYELNLPDDVEYLCFYSDTSAYNCLQDGGTCDEDLDGTLELVTEDSFNVYVYPTSTFERNRFLIESFEVENGNPECIANGKSILITAHDDYVGITYNE
tara:strand:- start:1252 stop:1746 length:495 start_codon:yes stop_codon:yes gene_type:complete